MYDYHPDLVCILFVRSHPYFYIFKKCFLLLVYVLMSPACRLDKATKQDIDSFQAYTI